MSLFSQTDIKQPDYDMIKTDIEDSDSRFYYPDLFKRFTDNDTILDKDDYSHLYFGFVFQDNYEPYEKSDLRNKLNVYAQRQESQLSTNDYDSLYKYTQLILEKYPFNIRDINKMTYYYHKTGDLDREEKSLYKAKMIIETILSSGDGKTESTAFHVNSPGHEYDILSAIGFQPVMQKLVGEYFDYLKVRRNKMKLKGIYFDITRIFKAQMAEYE